MSKPSALIFGGLNTCSRTLAAHLIKNSLVSHLRIIDKFSVHPPTTYLGSEFPPLLKNQSVEYKQANLTNEAVISPLFNPPEGVDAYEYVFDLTGEVRQDRTEVIQINSTCHVAKNIGLEAARRKVKAYVRLQHPFYDTGKAVPDESVDIKPEGTIGIWWHETLRILAGIPDLNLVIVRAGFMYGPYIDYGVVTSAMAVASVYGYMKRPMKSLWSPGKHPQNTVHVDDIAGAMWACAQWIAPLGRAEANKVAGEKIPFHNEKDKVKDVSGAPAYDATVIAPLFNIVDDASSTLVKTGTALTAFFGTTFEFFNLLESTVFKLKDDIVEDINEHHVNGWVEMLQKSNPPITSTPVTAYMDEYSLSKRVYAADNGKIKRIVGYTLVKPDGPNQDTIGDIIDKWKAEKAWPILD